MGEINKKKLSKFISYLLRHHPETLNLKIDDQGFVDIKELVNALNNPQVDEKVIRDLVKTSIPKRYEIVGNKIRALYGHTIKVDLNMPEVIPPEFLYHGTSREAIEKIKKEGIKPMARAYVHLSETKEEAFRVGLRKNGKPVILRIKAKEAHLNGIKFFKVNSIYLVREVPPNFIDFNYTFSN